MSDVLAPNVRAQFAKRLKIIRTQRGFDRARYFAKSLGIEENRYTRYERAEVEPSLTLIHKMCATLHVTPNELLGFAEFNDEGAFQTGPGMGELPGTPPKGQPHAAGNGNSGSLAWRLATEAACIGSEQASRGKALDDPLANFRETAALFQKLQADPFGTVAEIVDDPAVKGAPAARKTAIAELIRAFTESASGKAPARSR
ncbi:MAG TPA: helix-turn-helix transcriptional regulator [Hyphomicrobiaceae bacterium]|nr:helix-turn-helix transcriptional regulator [Hyphomicrobiaceae bacterium]